VFWFPKRNPLHRNSEQAGPDDSGRFLQDQSAIPGRMLLRVGTVAVVFLLALSLPAQQQMAKPQSALVIQGLGKGQVKLNGF
jgi:hypothetical protein